MIFTVHFSSFDEFTFKVFLTVKNHGRTRFAIIEQKMVYNNL